MSNFRPVDRERQVLVLAPEAMLDQLNHVVGALGKPETLLADSGSFSKAKVEACAAAKSAADRPRVGAPHRSSKPRARPARAPTAP